LNHLAGHIQLDFRSNEPLYLQIARQVEQLVSRGELVQGDQLPTVREMATELRINFNTVSRAYRLLDESGLISTQRGRGTYIWSAPAENVNQVLREHGLLDLTRVYLEDTRRLGYSDSEILQHLKTTMENREKDPTKNEERNEEK